jgi:hypothetical protein
MQKIAFILLFLSFAALAISQNNRNITIASIEKEIIEKNVDQVGIDLINQHNESLEKLYDYKLEAINNYNTELSESEKQKKFRKESFDDNVYAELKEDAEKARKEKINYFKGLYPGLYSNKRTDKKLVLPAGVRFKKPN